jgi:hypothetical protein
MNKRERAREGSEREKHKIIRVRAYQRKRQKREMITKKKARETRRKRGE